MSIKNIIRDLLPPFLLKTIRKVIHQRYGWKGNYPTWAEARSRCTGYDAENIVQRVLASLLKVKHGEAVYERDGVLFDAIQYSNTILSALLLASAKTTNRLSILDFGESLGSTYFQNKKMLNELSSVSWNIVEQAHFVEIGKKYFQDDILHFYYNKETCIKEQQPSLLILSSVLQYIETPFQLLQELIDAKFEFIAIDLTPLWMHANRITVQTVNPLSYEASYPCWLLNEKELDSIFVNNNYIEIEKFECLDGFELRDNKKDSAKYLGKIWKRL